MSTYNLKLAIGLDGVPQVVGGLKQVEAQVEQAGGRTTSATGRMTESFRGLAGMVGSLGGVFAGLSLGVVAQQMLAVNREVQSLKASLETVTGSQRGAEQAFSAIQQFAKETPFQLQQVTQAFIKLKALGLDSGQESLKAYGNTASAMGKSLDQMIEAVADAATGEFERLKEFGIRASQQGDRVKFTFRGVTTTVAKSADEIEGYLRSIGQVQFAGAMERQMQTLNGRISNLQDNWAALMTALGESGGADAAANGIGILTEAIDRLRKAIKATAAEDLAHLRGELQRTTEQLDAMAKTPGLAWAYGGFDSMRAKQAALRQQVTMADIKANPMADSWLVRNQGMAEANDRAASMVDAIDDKALEKARQAAEQYAAALHQLADARRASNPLLSEEARETERLGIQYDALVAKYPAHRAELERNHALDLRQIQLAQQLRTEQEQTKQSLAALTAAMAEGQAITGSVATAQEKFATEIERLDALFLAGHVGLEAYWRKIEQLYVDLEAGPKKAAEAHRQLMDEINGMSFEAPGVTSFGDPLTDGIGKSIEAVNRLNLAYVNQQKHLAAIEAQRAKIDKTTVKGSKEQADALAALGKQEQRAAEVNFQTQLGGYRELFGTTKTLFAEQSKERKALHALEQTFAAVEIALNMQKALTAATTAIATQGSGDPYSAFARIAAMTALMGGVLAMAGISFGGGGGGSASAPAARPGSGTVLGDPQAVSDSSARVLELLEDIHASEYRELRGIHDSMRDLNSNIKGLVSGIFRTIGGFEGGTTIGSAGLTRLGNQAVDWLQQIPFDTSELLAKPLEKLLGSGLGSMAGGLLGLPGQAFDKLLEFGGKAISTVFGGKVRTSVTGSGLSMGAISIGDLLGGRSADVQQYADIYQSKSGGWFGKKKVSTWREYAAVDEEITRLFSAVFADMGQTLTTLAKGLGADVNQALSYVFAIDAINLKDKSSEEVNEILSGVISAAGDSAAKAVLGGVVSAYQQVGEGLLETAVRLYATQEVVRDTLEMTGQQMSGDAIALSQALADLAGGVKELREAAESYYDKFFSDAEKQADLTKKLSASMGDLNMILPASRQGYRNLVEALDLNNEADRERYVRLMELASGADRYYQALENGAEKALASLRQNLTETLGAARNAAEALRQILGGPLGGASPERLYAERLQAFEQARRLGRADELPELGKALLEASRAYNASGAGYQSDLDTVTRALGQIAGIQGSPTLSAAERQVQLLDDIRAAIEDQNLEQLRLLSAQTGLLSELVRQYLGAQGQRPSFAVGSAYIPRDMTANIHQGEMIIDRASAQVLRKYGIPASGGDNREVVRVLEKMEARLERVEAHTAANVRVNQAGFSQTIALNEKQAAASSELAGKTRLAGAA